MVWRTARTLDAALAGRVLTRSDFRVPRYATTDLTGRTVTETLSRGKHLLTRVDGGVTIHTHLRMDGSWRVRAGRLAAAAITGSGWCWLTMPGRRVGRLLGVVEVLPTKDEEKVVGHLGPDLLGPDWDPDEAVRRLRAGPDRPVGEALLDQRNLAGIGNFTRPRCCSCAGSTRGAGRRHHGPDGPGRSGAAAAGRQQEPDRPGDHRRGRARPGNLGIRQAGPPCRRCGTQIRSTGRSGTSRADQGTDNEERVTFGGPAVSRPPGDQPRRPHIDAACRGCPPARRMRASVRAGGYASRLRNRISPAISAITA